MNGNLAGLIIGIIIFLILLIAAISKLWNDIIDIGTAIDNFGTKTITNMSGKVPDVINKGTDALGSTYQYISGLTVFLLLILFATIVVFFTNIFTYVLDTDTKLNQYYNEQNICGKNVLEKDTLRFRMPQYHKERFNSSFRWINYITLITFGTIGLLLFKKRNVLFGVALFFAICNLVIIIVNEAYLQGSIDETGDSNIYNLGNMNTIKQRINKLLTQESYADDIHSSSSAKVSCPLNNPLCNFPSKLKDRLEKRIKINNDLTTESVSSFINSSTDKATLILSYLNFTPESNDLELLFDKDIDPKDIDPRDYSERKNINYLRTINDKINVNDKEGIYNYYKRVYTPYVAIAIVSALLIFFIVFMLFKRIGVLNYLIGFIIVLYIIAYVLGLSFG
jgi:hypothetical protein